MVDALALVFAMLGGLSRKSNWAYSFPQWSPECCTVFIKNKMDLKQHLIIPSSQAKTHTVWSKTGDILNWACVFCLPSHFTHRNIPHWSILGKVKKGPARYALDATSTQIKPPSSPKITREMQNSITVVKTRVAGLSGWYGREWMIKLNLCLLVEQYAACMKTKQPGYLPNTFIRLEPHTRANMAYQTPSVTA